MCSLFPKLYVICCLLPFLAHAQSSIATSASWEYLADDLEMAKVKLREYSLFPTELLLFRTSLRKFRVGVIRAIDYGSIRNTVEILCKLSKAVLCINANFFDEDGHPLGLVIKKGTTYQKIHRGGNVLTGIFNVSRDKPSIISRNTFQPGSILEAIQAGPRLIVGGEAVEDIRDSGHSRRSGVCIDKEKRLVFYVTTSGLVGASISELQSALSHRSIECNEALNLDGGGSSQLYLNPHAPGLVIQSQESKYFNYLGQDPVPIALGFFVEAG